MPQGASTAEKTAIMRSAFPALKAKVKELFGTETLGAVLIGAVTYRVCADALRCDGVNVLNKAAINHPARGGQVSFRAGLTAALSAVS